MKVRITKVPDNKLDSRNARKWNHAEGGLIDRLLTIYGGDRLAVLNALRDFKKGGRLPNAKLSQQEEPLGPPIPQSVLKKRFAVSDIKRRLMEIENSKTNPKGGWNEEEQRWYPHKSAEGGAKTIAYGIKMSSSLPFAKLALEQGYLTDEQAQSALTEMSGWYYDDAQKVFDKKYGKGTWDLLNWKQQSILTDYQYNVKDGGLAKFPNLMQAMYDGDIDKMKKESSRTWTDSSGVKRHLVKRNDAMLVDIDSLRTHYPVDSLAARLSR